MSSPAGEEAQLTSAAPAEQLMIPIEERRQQDRCDTLLARYLKTEQECLSAKIQLLGHEEATSKAHEELQGLHLQIAVGESDLEQLVLAGERQQLLLANLKGEEAEHASEAATLLADAESKCAELVEANEAAVYNTTVHGQLALGRKEAAEEQRVNKEIRRRELAVSARLENQEEQAQASITLKMENASYDIARSLRDSHLRAEAATKLGESMEAESRQVAVTRLMQEQWHQRQHETCESEEAKIRHRLVWQEEESVHLKTEADRIHRQLALASEEAESARWDCHEAWLAQEEAWTAEHRSSMYLQQAQEDLLATARQQSWPAAACGYGPWGPPCWGPPQPYRRRQRGGRMEKEGLTRHLKQPKGCSKGNASDGASSTAGE